MPGTGAGAQAAERRVALVLGNAQYQQGGTVPTVAANANAVADALRRAGFEVTVARNLDHRGTVAALNRFQESLDGAELGFLYYSGLALSLSGKGYLIPVDAKLAKEGDIAFDTLDLDRILQDVNATGRKSVVVLDPVAANPLADKLAASMGPSNRSVRPVLDEPVTLDRMFVVYSHRPGVAPRAVSGDKPGPFAGALAERMLQPGANFHEILGETARIVMERTGGQQHPWLRDRLEGELVLVPADADPAALAAASPEEGTAAPARPEIQLDPMDEPMRVTRDTNLRSGPDTSYSVLRVMRGGHEVTATGRVRGADWLRVEHRGTTGYATAANLAPPAPPAAPPSAEEVPVAQAPTRPEEPEAQAPAAEARPATAPGVYTVLRETTMFALPVLGARGLRMLDPGMMVTVVESVPEGNWLRIRDRFGTEGFVTAAALSSYWDEAPSPSGAPSFPVARNDLPPDALQGALSGSSSSVEVAALPDGSDAMLPATGAAPLTLAPPVQQAVASARDAAARAASGPSSAAGIARQAQTRARQAQAEARRAADEAQRGGSQNSVHRFPNGDVYAGGWAVVDGNSSRGYLAKNGVGVYRFANGQVYEGEWRNDTMTGNGVLAFGNGDRYEGGFQGGLPQGNGVYHFANGVTYAGEIKRGRVEGYGELTFTNGDRYAGMVVDRLPSGYGELIQRGGSRHAGQFRRGTQDGPGALVTAEGGMQGGHWYGATMLRP
nr:SH3 domain-containing protein [Azospirillum sp. SYSU D00513]